jgi:hypothetical protein
MQHLRPAHSKLTRIEAKGIVGFCTTFGLIWLNGYHYHYYYYFDLSFIIIGLPVPR